MTTQELIINIVISATTGVAASFLVWWFTISKMVPQIKFAEQITKIKSNENSSGYRYRFKFENSGKRDIIDLQIIVRMRIKGLRSDFPENNEIVYIPTSTMEYKNVAILRPTKKNSKRAVLEVITYECKYFERNIFPEEIRTKAQNKEILLDDIFSLKDEVDLQIIILGYDSFSGIRKYFESKFYSKNDIIYGTYEQTSLNVVRTSEVVISDSI